MLGEIDERVIEEEGFSEDQLAVLHKEGPQSELAYRLAWARTYLKGMGAIANPERGRWVTTEAGKNMTEAEMEPERRAYLARLSEARQLRNTPPGASAAEPGEPDEGETWREELLGLLMSMDPRAFEHLAKRLLRAAGFVNATVTGGAGDEGIDGVGVYRLSLVSFPVYFQCKRYRGTVGPEKVRDFRGAMQGRGDKGLLITTGTFTASAKREATRDGAPPIDLIDGARLCDLLREHRLGVEISTRTVEDVTIVAEFFSDPAMDRDPAMSNGPSS